VPVVANDLVVFYFFRLLGNIFRVWENNYRLSGKYFRVSEKFFRLYKTSSVYQENTSVR
jgi:hypothetical protein